MACADIPAVAPERRNVVGSDRCGGGQGTGLCRPHSGRPGDLNHAARAVVHLAPVAPTFNGQTSVRINGGDFF